MNDTAFDYQAFTGTEGLICFDTTAEDNSLFSLGQDLNQDGMLDPDDGEIGVPFGFWERQFIVMSANSLVARAGVADMGVDDEITDWYRVCLYINFVENGGEGSGSLFYRNLSNGDNTDTYLADLQSLNLNLTNAPNPAEWDAMFLKLRVDSFDLIPKVDNLMPNTPLP